MARENIDTMLDLSQPDNVRRAQMSLVGREGFHRLIVKKSRGTASQLQRGYYFTVVMGTYEMYLRDYCGWRVRDSDEAHEVAKLVFLGKAIEGPDGKTRKIAGSTAGMTTLEMAEHIDAVRMEMDLAGYVTPDPDKNWRGNPPAESKEEQSPSHGITAA